jgi:hypothetical protein
MGRSDGRPWGLSVAAYGEIPMAAVIIVDVEVNGFVENADEVFDRRRVVAGVAVRSCDVLEQILAGASRPI